MVRVDAGMIVGRLLASMISQTIGPDHLRQAPASAASRSDCSLSLRLSRFFATL